MSGDSSRDHVFGAVARALGPRAHVPFGKPPALVRDVEWLEVSFWLDALSLEDRRVLESMRVLARPGADGVRATRALATPDSAAPDAATTPAATPHAPESDSKSPSRSSASSPHSPDEPDAAQRSPARAASSGDSGGASSARRSEEASPSPRPRRERAVVACPRFALADAARSSASLRALLAAHDAAVEPPRPPRVMGIVNVTPDSFSDGGRYADTAPAVAHALELEAQGATILDVGGESTRPGSLPVSLEEELRRVVPVVAALAKSTRVAISVDTTKSAVARAAIDAGASLVNDVTAGRFDREMLALVAARRVGYVAMHMLGTPRDMQVDPRYEDVVGDVLEFLRERAAAALAAGVAPEKLWIDPGIGFGKTTEHNVALLRALPDLRSLGLPIVLGVSRKSFLARLYPPAAEDRERRGGTAAACTIGIVGGAEVLRVHDVALACEVAAVTTGITRARPGLA